VALLAIVLAAAHASADEPPTTLVLIGAPPTLIDAVTTSLAPWQIRVVVLPSGSDDVDVVAARHGAGFIATVRGRTLELRERDADTQTRALAADVDDVEAATAALSIKTWMRLGPPPEAAPPIDPPVDPRRDPTLAPPTDAGAAPPRDPTRPVQLEALAAVGVRGNQGGLGTGPRLHVGLGARTRWLDAALALDLGTAVDSGRIDGVMWAQHVLIARVGRRLAVPRGVWLRPSVGVAVRRAHLDGVQVTSGRAVDKVTWAAGVEAVLEAFVERDRWFATVAAGTTAYPSTQELHGQLRLTIEPHLEPWATIGGGWRLW